MTVRGARRAGLSIVARLLRVAPARRRLSRLATRSGRARDLQAARATAAAAAGVLRAAVGQPGGSTALEVAIALNTLADLHLEAVALPAALEALDEAVDVLETEGDIAQVLAIRCDALVRRGTTQRLRANWPQAHADLDAALRTAPDQRRRAGALNARGILAKDTGDLERAAAAYAEAHAILT